MLRAACVLSALAAPVAACTVPPWTGAVPGSEVLLATDDAAALSRAWYSDLTDAYGHAILGDGLEPTVLHGWSSLTSAGCGLSISAGAGHVFEDIAPRLVDVTGDTRPEIVAIRTSVTQGAQLVIYGATDGGLTVIAQTPYIGRSRRWLAPAAIADLDGDGRVEIAYVDRPHLAKVLRIWRFDDGDLTEVAAVQGVTNHRIGEDFISGGLRVCDAGPEIVLASADWTRLLALRFDGTDITARDLGVWGPDRAQAAMTCAF